MALMVRHDDIRLHLQPGHQVSPERGPGVLPGWSLGGVASVTRVTFRSER
jgi:hypothetical protein